MSRCSEWLSNRLVARALVALSLLIAELDGTILPRSFESFRKALVFGDGYAMIRGYKVVGYAECRLHSDAHSIHTVLADPECRNLHIGTTVLQNRLEECWRRDPEKPVILTCTKFHKTWYMRFGFKHQHKKSEAPEYIRGDRSEAMWLESDRIWMKCLREDYLKMKERGFPMVKPNVFVKISGNLLESQAVIEWLVQLSKSRYVVICIGGGEQISEAFKEHGFPIEFGPMGRITDTFPERQLARNVLELNQVTMQDLIDEKGINARVIIPVEDIGGVLCHVNGDIYLLAAYNGFDELYLLTTNDRVEKKKQWLRQVATVFSALQEGVLEKIEVIGF